MLSHDEISAKKQSLAGSWGEDYINKNISTLNTTKKIQSVTNESFSDTKINEIKQMNENKFFRYVSSYPL